MARNIDDFARDLNAAAQEVTRAAVNGANNRANARKLYDAAANGGEAAVRKAAQGMSRSELEAAHRILRKG